MGGEPFEFNGNVPNPGLIASLPEGVAWKSRCWTMPQLSPGARRAAAPEAAGHGASLTVAVEEMAVEAALTGHARLGLSGHLLRPAYRTRAS